MQHTAGYLEKKGFTPGLWFMPFSGDVRNPHFPKEIFAQHRWTGAPYEVKRWSGTCIDATSPAGESFCGNVLKEFTIGDIATTKSMDCTPVRLLKISM